MKACIVFLLTLVAGLGIVAAVPAQCGVASAVVVKKDVVVVAEVAPVAVFQAVPVFVPVFSVGYQPYGPPAAPPPAAAAPDLAAELRRISERLDRIERTRPGAVPPSLPTVTPRASDASAGPQGAAPRGGPVGTALAVYQSKCAQCHQAGREDKGGGFVLLDAAGGRVQLTDAQRAKTMSKSYSGKMPPKDNDQGIAPLTDEEVSLVFQDLKN